MTVREISCYVVAFIAGFLVTYLLTPYCRKLAFALNTVDRPDPRRIHQNPIPSSGGLAIFIGFHAACAVVFLLPWEGARETLSYDWWIRLGTISTAIFVLGLTDDIKGFSPLIKLAGQIIIASLAFFFGFKMGSILGYELPMMLDVLLTVGWIVAIMNAFNLVDGMDGLATGLALIAALGIFCGLLLQGNLTQAVILIALAGPCLAFLRFNFHPARIFLGDSGSLLLGFLVALLALTTSSKSTAIVALGVPIFAVGVPLIDTVLAVWRRSIRRLLHSTEEQGVSPSGLMSADAEHLHHRLLHTGLTQHQAAIILYGLNIALIAVAVTALLYHSSATGIFVLSFVAGVYVIVRHLARLELWQTGRLIAQGLKRPPRRGISSLLYPVIDVMALAIALICALLFLKTTGQTLSNEAVIRVLTPLWISIPFILLVVSGMYQRVWSRARLTDFFKLGSILTAGLLVSCGLTSLVTNALDTTGLVLLTVFEFLLVIPAIFANRIFMRLILELTATCDRRSLWPDECSKVMIYGAGNTAMSLLKEMSHPEHTSFENCHVMGFLDDDPALRGRFVYGYKVRGGLDELTEIAKKDSLDKVIVTVPVSSERKHQLLNLAEQHNFTVTEWVTMEQPLAPQDVYTTEGGRGIDHEQEVERRSQKTTVADRLNDAR